MRKVAVALFILYVLPLLCACSQPMESSRAMVTASPSMIQPTVTPTIQPTVIPAITPTIAPTPTPSPTPAPSSKPLPRKTPKLHGDMSVEEVFAVLGKPSEPLPETELFATLHYPHIYMQLSRQDLNSPFTIDMIFDFTWLDETVGGMNVEMSKKEILELLGEPEKKDTAEFDEYFGGYSQTWYYPSKGIEILLFWQPNKEQDASIDWIIVTAPFAGKTAHGISIGSTLEEVYQAYGEGIYPAQPPDGKSIIVGSVFGGMILKFENEIVTSIAIGRFGE